MKTIVNIYIHTIGTASNKDNYCDQTYIHAYMHNTYIQTYIVDTCLLTSYSGIHAISSANTYYKETSLTEKHIRTYIHTYTNQYTIMA